jgi:hypothetical protein
VFLTVIQPDGTFKAVDPAREVRIVSTTATRATCR